MEGYSLDNYNNAKQESLSADDQKFIDDYHQKLEGVVARIKDHPDSQVSSILKELTRPDLWKVLLRLRKAERIVDRAAATKKGQIALAEEEAWDMNEEYDRRAKAIQDEFAKFENHPNASTSIH